MHEINQDIDINQKQPQKIKKMFNKISSVYDFLNSFLSLCMDSYWRKNSSVILKKYLKDNSKVLDICCGTGKYLLTLKNLKKDVNDYYADFAFDMLKIFKNNHSSKKIICTDANRLSIKTKFDIIMIAFGVRNFNKPLETLENLKYILDDNGYIAILEFFKPKNRIYSFLYKIYLNLYVPLIGRIFSKTDAYKYLKESIRGFYDISRFCELLKIQNFEIVYKKNYLFDICSFILIKKRLSV